MSVARNSDRFHGRINGARQKCSSPGCREAGEFRAPIPGGRTPSSNGPGDYQFLCLTHVRAFNAAYDFYAGMTAEQITEAQSPLNVWPTEVRAFRASGGVDAPPKWADFSDPLDAISARFRGKVAEAIPKVRADGKPLSPADQKALKTLGLSVNSTAKELRTAYSALLRQYHPDKNGGERSHEKKLQAVVEAYQQLRKSPAFGK